MACKSPELIKSSNDLLISLRFDTVILLGEDCALAREKSFSASRVAPGRPDVSEHRMVRSSAYFRSKAAVTERET